MILCVICVNYLIQSPLPRNNPAIRRGDKKYQNILAIQKQNTCKQGTRPRFACGPFQDILRRSRPCPAWPPVQRCRRVFWSTCRDPTVGPPPCNATNAGERDHFGSCHSIPRLCFVPLVMSLPFHYLGSIVLITHSSNMFRCSYLFTQWSHLYIPSGKLT